MYDDIKLFEYEFHGIPTLIRIGNSWEVYFIVEESHVMRLDNDELGDSMSGAYRDEVDNIDFSCMYIGQPCIKYYFTEKAILKDVKDMASRLSILVKLYSNLPPLRPTVNLFAPHRLVAGFISQEYEEGTGNFRMWW